MHSGAGQSRRQIPFLRQVKSTLNGRGSGLPGPVSAAISGVYQAAEYGAEGGDLLTGLWYNYQLGPGYVLAR